MNIYNEGNIYIILELIYYIININNNKYKEINID